MKTIEAFYFYRSKKMRRLGQILAWAIVFVAARQVWATDRYFSDIAAKSPNGNYEVQAKSPDNENKEAHLPFQAKFVYTCVDKRSGKTLWTRKQPMETHTFGDKDQAEEFTSPKEGSPVAIFVSDTGWTVIRTGWDELIAVDINGRDKCRIKLLSQAMSQSDVDKYVHRTTAGPQWSGYSLWYFLDVSGRLLFVIRPWWGNRMIVDLDAGKLVQQTDAVAECIAKYERNYVLSELRKAVETRKQWDRDDRDCYNDQIWSILTAAYLAGRLQVTAAAPYLEKLQDANYSGSSTSGGLGALEKFEGEVNPHSYSTFTMRQVVQLSLRRLGRAPKPLPANQFDVQYEDYKKHHPYVSKVKTLPNRNNADKVERGMKAEQVLDLIGAPDFVGYDTWEYDIDADAPYSLIVKWDARRVIGVEKKTPPLWKDGFKRDEQIIH